VQGQKTEWTNLGSQGLSQTIQLSRGNWTISLRGFATDALRTAAGTSETASTQAVFEGTLNQDIGSNLTSRNENVNVSLNFTNPSGTGSYSLGVTIPASYASQRAKVKVTVTPASGEAQVQIYQFASGTTTHTYSFATVNNGIASVKVEYLDASDAAIGDAVTANTLIMTDMTTNGSATIAEDNTFTVSFAGTRVNGSAESATAEKIEFSGDAFVVIDQGMVADFKLPVSGYNGQQVKLYVADSPNYTQSEVISNGLCATVALDSYGQGFGEVVSSETKGFSSSPQVVIDGITYLSIADAFAASQEGDTLQLVKDIDMVEQDPIEYNKSFNITFDLCNHSLSNISDGMEFVVTGSGILNVKNKGNSSLSDIREYKKVAIVVTSLDGASKSNVFFATLCETSM
ncbi:MAG: hypothetical protein MR563_08520, partial [Spirochaetales bacterium]|nr:hypothetical protein [Spirochaetales bacterium]